MYRPFTELHPYSLHAANFYARPPRPRPRPTNLLWTGNIPLTLIAGFALAAITLIAASIFITTRQAMPSQKICCDKLHLATVYIRAKWHTVRQCHPARTRQFAQLINSVD